MTASVDAALDDLMARPAEDGVTFACVAMRGGEVLAERYGVRPANDFQPEEPIDADTALLSWSMAKSITHAAVGVLVVDGRLDLDAPAPVPEWDGTPKAAVTTLDLLEMRPGLRFVEDYVDGDTSHCIEMLFGGTDPSHARYAASLPLDHDPGSVYNYSSGTSNIVARIVGDVVAADAGVTADDVGARRDAIDRFLRERLFGPVGMASAAARFDDAGDFVGSSYVDATARDFARFGELYAFDGVTDRGGGHRILPVGWLDHARMPRSHDAESGFGYGRHWWLWPAFPGSLACHGYDGQYVLVLPEDDVVLVHLGATEAARQRALTMRLARTCRFPRETGG
ncbi:MAG: serine hydrolase domain-containing protein, partial [Actinomycetota bacterium]